MLRDEGGKDVRTLAGMHLQAGEVLFLVYLAVKYGFSIIHLAI